MEKHIRTFSVVDGQGNRFELDEYQEFRDVTTKDSAAREYMPGMKRLHLRGRGHVNFIDENTFEVATTGERLTLLR